MKKIIGYKLIKDTPTTRAGVIFKSTDTYHYYPEGIVDSNQWFHKDVISVNDWFEPVYEEEYNVGDWVYDINNEFNLIREQCLQILKIDYNGIWCKDFCGSSRLSETRFKECYRKATKEEIEKAKSSQYKVRLGGYDSVICKDGVAFGCKIITTEELKAVKTVFELNSKILTSSFNLISAMYIGDIRVDMITKFIEGSKTATQTLKEAQYDNLPF